MFLPPTESLTNESDVEQKLLWPLLSDGLGYRAEEIRTKRYLAPSDIDKGAGKKVGYYPDYAVCIAGLPVLIAEAKAPDESVEAGFRDAQMYAHTVNRGYPPGVNPICYVMACNGRVLVSGRWDSNQFSQTQVDDLAPGTSGFEDLRAVLGREVLLEYACSLRNQLLPVRRFKPIRLIGGPSRQNAQLPPNSFAEDLLPLLRQYFDPDATSRSRSILERAYCSSDEVTHYNAALEALLKDNLARKKGFRTIETTKRDAPILNEALRRAIANSRQGPEPLILIVGGVGTGKSMFLERFYTFLLGDELKANLLWTLVDFNRAPDDLSGLESWICNEFVRDFGDRNGDEHLLDLENLRRYFAPKIRQLNQGPYRDLRRDQPAEYQRRMADHLAEWMHDPESLASGIIRYHSRDRNVPVVAVFDNADRRDRDQQLRVFQVVQWFRMQNQCFCILSLRDETYDAYQDEPPLDAFLKPFAFRILPPRFIDVASKRLRLMLEDLVRAADRYQSYTLPNGMQLRYPGTKLGRYLFDIYMSLFNPSRRLRLILEALAGRNVRRALEMFTAILISGYMSENLIFAMTEGRRRDLPEWLVLRILMRTNYRYFSDGHGYVQNLFALDEESRTAHGFMLLELLDYLATNRKRVSSLRIEGYLYVPEVIAHMVKLGVTREDVMWALELLLRRGLITADHQRSRGIAGQDYVKISASGHCHYVLLAEREEYLANVTLDTWFNDKTTAQAVSRLDRDSRHHRKARIQLLRNYLIKELTELERVVSDYDENQRASRRQIRRIGSVLQRIDSPRLTAEAPRHPRRR